MKLLYIINGFTGFHFNDQKILESLGETVTLNYRKRWNILNPKIIKYVYQSDKIIIWFASFHAIPAIIVNYFFNKPIFIIAGGFDVANVKNINYGAMQRHPRKYIGRWILSNARKVIAVSNSNKNEIIINGKVDKKKICLSYNAINLNIPNFNKNKQEQILTVGEINEETVLRKGLDRYIIIAREFPDIQFIHIGKWTNRRGESCESSINKIRASAPKNIKFLGFVKKSILEKYYKLSKIYLQLSRHEAFGLSVIEAMSYNCIPIVSDAFSLPEIIGKNGFVVKNKKDCIDAVKQSLSKSSKIDIKINPMFNIEYRRLFFQRLLSK